MGKVGKTDLLAPRAVENEQVGTANFETNNYKARLHLSRRIDWRFLLPNPELSRVAYLGPAEKTLLEALEYFSDSLTIITPLELGNDLPGSPGEFDLLVAHSPEVNTVMKSLAYLKPDGYLYWEIERFLWRKLLPRKNIRWKFDSKYSQNIRRHAVPGPVKAHDYAACLQRLGLSGIEMHWHYPDFKSCREIIPLHDPIALHYALDSRGNTSISGRIKLFMGRFLMNSGLLPYLVPCFSLTAHNRGSR